MLNCQRKLRNIAFVMQSLARFYLQPLLYGDTQQGLILCLNLIAVQRVSEHEDSQGDIYFGDEGEADFKIFDILREIKSKISKKTHAMK
jgi:hypothetical protein